MAKMSQNVKEIIQVVVFVLVVAILIIVFVVYPLNRTKAFLARPDVDSFKPDPLPTNDISAFAEFRATVDTFRVDADGLTSLACAYMTPRADTLSPDVVPPIRGSAILLHAEGVYRKAMLPLAKMLIDSGWAVCLYDQRASGLSSGRYHSDGELEAADLTEVIAYLRIRDRVVHPFVAVGESNGADAALLAAAEENYFDAVVAVKPYLTTERWLDILMANHDMYWMPFSHTIFKFWYELRSWYAPEYRKLENLRAPLCRTLIVDTEARLADEAVTEYLSKGEPGEITTAVMPAETNRLDGDIMTFVRTVRTEQ